MLDIDITKLEFHTKQKKKEEEEEIKETLHSKPPTVR